MGYTGTVVLSHCIPVTANIQLGPHIYTKHMYCSVTTVTVTSISAFAISQRGLVSHARLNFLWVFSTSTEQRKILSSSMKYNTKFNGKYIENNKNNNKKYYIIIT